MSARKDYRPLPDSKLDRLKADSQAILGSTFAQLSLPAKTVYWMAMELIDLREEIFRLQLCETVDQILAKELDRDLNDEEEALLAFCWPDDSYLARDMISTVSIPAFPCKETVEIPCPPDPSDPSPDQTGRRLPRVN